MNFPTLEENAPNHDTGKKKTGYPLHLRHASVLRQVKRPSRLWWIRLESTKLESGACNPWTEADKLLKPDIIYVYVNLILRFLKTLAQAREALQVLIYMLGRSQEQNILKWQSHWRLLPLLMYLDDLWQGAAQRPTYTPTMVLILWVLIVSSGRAWRGGTSNKLLIFCLRRKSSDISIRQDHPTFVVFGMVWSSPARKPSELYFMVKWSQTKFWRQPLPGRLLSTAECLLNSVLIVVT